MQRQQGDPINDELNKATKNVQNYNEVKNISELPNELLLTIFSYLPARDVLKLERVSKKFQQVSQEPLAITRVHFSEMTGNNVPLLFPPGEMFRCILRFAKFLDSKRTKNVKSLDVNFDFMDKGLNNFCLMETYVNNLRDDYKLMFYASLGVRNIFTDLFWDWPCPNLEEFGFVLNLHHHKFQKHHEHDRMMHEIEDMFHKLRNSCPNLKTLNMTVYPHQPNFRRFFLGLPGHQIEDNGELGLLDSLSKWLLPDYDTMYDESFYIGNKRPKKIARLKHLNLKFALPINGRKDINSYLGIEVRRKINSMKNLQIQVIRNQNEDKHECVRGFCWAIRHPEDPEYY